MKKYLKIIVLCLVSLFILSCGDSAATNKGKIAFESEDKKVVVYESEVEYELGKISPEILSKVTEAELTNQKNMIIQNLALIKAVALEAEEQKIKENPRYKEGFELAKTNLLFTLFLETKSLSVTVTPEEVETYYNTNKSKFTTTEDLASIQIIIFNAQNPDAKAKAEDILKQVTAEGADFSVIGEALPTDVAQMGQTALTSVNQLSNGIAVLKTAIEATEAGKVYNNLIETQNEIYIIKVLDKQAAGTIPLEQVKNRITAELLNSKQSETVNTYISEVFKKYNLDKIGK